jgi:hypothetical protein
MVARLGLRPQDFVLRRGKRVLCRRLGKAERHFGD